MSERASDSANSINVFEQIDIICREFRKQWKSNQRPDIGEYLSRVDLNAHGMLFRNLLGTEIRARSKLGETPGSREYLDRFPQFAAIIRQEFDESTILPDQRNTTDHENFLPPGDIAPSDNEQSDADDNTQTIQDIAATRLGEYELLKELGRGGFGGRLRSPSPETTKPRRT